MSLPIFPTLPGQGIEVKKTPRFATRVAAHASGREGRARSYLTPLWDFELVFDGLASDHTIYPNLGEETMQTLAGFFMAVQGQALPFLYLDPIDSVATARQIGVGNGTNKTFTLTHSIGVYAAPVECVISATAVYYNGVRQYVTLTYPTANSLEMPTAPGAGVVVTADYTYAYQVRFSEDVVDLEEFMSLLHTCRTVKFQTARQPIAPQATATVAAVFANSTDFVVPGLIDMIECYSGGAGGSGGAAGTWFGAGAGGTGGGGGAYAYVRNPSIAAGETISIVIGTGGQGLVGDDWYGSDINKGGDTYIAFGTTTIVGAYGAGKGDGGYLFTPGSVMAGSGSAGGDGGWFPGLAVNGGAGGGGAGGPNGPGGNGATNALYAGNGGGGGGAGDGGGGGSPCQTGSDAPGAGGTSVYGGGQGGAGGTASDDGHWPPGYPSTLVAGWPGADGGNEISVFGSGGSGGGGGGGGYCCNGGKGGAFGGGGGGGGGGLQGGGYDEPGSGGPATVGGNGGDGGVVITFTINA